MVQSLARGLPRGNDQVPSTRARPEPLFTPRRRIRQIRRGSPSSSPGRGSGHPLSNRHLRWLFVRGEMEPAPYSSRV